MKIVLTGPKGAGKSSIGCALAASIDIPFYDTDTELEKLYASTTGDELSCREIFRTVGEEAFRRMETDVVNDLAHRDWCIIASGGSTFSIPANRTALRHNSIIIMLTADTDILWRRVAENGIPAYLTSDDPAQEFAQRAKGIQDSLAWWVDAEIDAGIGDVNDVTSRVYAEIVTTMARRTHAPNTFGDVIRVTTFGESHGKAIGCVLDGVQPETPISQEDIQHQLDRRRPGQSDVSTPRKERDEIHILSGVFEGKATGAPICMILYNTDQKPSAYEGIRDLFRPGHADFTFWKKYGIRDHRGGGRSSGRETAGRVAAGAIARNILATRGITFCAYAKEIAGITADSFDPAEIEKNPVRCADPAAAIKMEDAIIAAKNENNSVGGIIELRIQGVPVGLGDPVFCKLDARLAMALLSIGATKGIEIGDGFAAAKAKGNENNDAMKDNDFLSNHAGGIIGGISNGNEIILRVAVKPTSSISQTQETITIAGDNTEICVEGRHDPCIVPRIIPVIEAMAALVILDAWEVQTHIKPGWPDV